MEVITNYFLSPLFVQQHQYKAKLNAPKKKEKIQRKNTSSIYICSSSSKYQEHHCSFKMQNHTKTLLKIH